MSIISVGFILFTAIGLLVFYNVPKKYQWIVLLAMSIIFSVCADWKNLIFIAGVSAVAYFSCIAMEKISGNTELDKKTIKAKKGVVLKLALLLLVGLLVVLRYLNIAVGAGYKVANLFGSEAQFSGINIFVPIAISYYTLQVLSYILDVYWNRCGVEHNYLRVLLFTSYFPQMIQGPISKYELLSEELKKNVPFEWKNIKFGVQLILWGYMKKLVIGDRVGEVVNGIFHSDITPYGLDIFFGLVLYGIQLYCDFSGGMDIVRGVSECFGINLPINFRQPYFSDSLSEFWRRWHMTLGDWM